MSIDLAFDDAQQAIADALSQFCDDQDVGATEDAFPSALWSQIAELGVLALVTPEGDGGAREMVAACEALGRAVFPGPLAHTFFATQVLEPGDRVEVAMGRAVVSVGRAPLLPWAQSADLFIDVDGDRAWKAAPTGAIEPVETLAGEPWGRVELSRGEPLSDTSRGHALYDIALASYLTGAGCSLVEETSNHARTRKQFGRPIGDFQAVAHPLADCEMRLACARVLARRAACCFDADPQAVELRALAGGARLSACAASVETSYVCHQLFGAIGITLEGPVFRYSRKIRQLASQQPDAASARAAVLQRFGL